MDVKNHADIDKILVLLRKRGVKSFKFGELEIELLPEVPPSNYKKKKLEIVSDQIETNDLYDDEAALFWSSAGIPPEKEAI